MKIVVIGRGANTLYQTEGGGGGGGWGKKASACHCKPVNGVQLRIRGDECVSKRKETGPAKESSGSDISVSRSGWLSARFWTCRDAASTKTGNHRGRHDGADSWKLMQSSIARTRVSSGSNTRKKTDPAGTKISYYS